MTTQYDEPGAAARALAARVLDAVLNNGRSLKAELQAALPGVPDVRDRALVEAMVFSALREQARYSATLDAWLARPLGRRDGLLRALLLAGFAQIDAMGLPAHAAVGATVDAAKVLGRTHQAGLVNAVLRRAVRDGVPAATSEAGWPEWLLTRIDADWPGETEAILTASATPAPMWLRVNRRHGSRDDYRARLDVAGLACEIPDGFDDALVLGTPVPVAELPGFAEGLVSVQDGSAQRVADALSPAAGMRVLDACAAPGGKAAHLAERDGSLAITALDIDARRVRRMQEGFARQGLAIDARTADATALDGWWDGVPFDRVLIDAPCSASGIVRRQPDVLLHRREDDIATLQATQARLLDALWPVLGRGGMLVYATCSILADENARQVEAFLARTPEARLQPLDARFGRDTGAGHQRLPGEGGMDGFFLACLAKA